MRGYTDFEIIVNLTFPESLITRPLPGDEELRQRQVAYVQTTAYQRRLECRKKQLKEL
jgi:hypothetical protein